MRVESLTPTMDDQTTNPAAGQIVLNLGRIVRVPMIIDGGVAKIIEGFLWYRNR